MSDSGEIGREELPGIIGLLGHTPNPEMNQDAFEKCDKNKISEIGFEELVKLMRIVRQTDGFSFVRGAFAPSGLSWFSCLEWAIPVLRLVCARVCALVLGPWCPPLHYTNSPSHFFKKIISEFLSLARETAGP